MNMLVTNRNNLAPRRVDLFSEVHKEFDRVFNEVFGAPFFNGVNKHKGYPLLDAIRQKSSLSLQYAVPGVKKNDLSVEIVDDDTGSLLIVSGKLSDSYIAEENDYQIRELSRQDFRRIVRLPEDVEIEKEPVVYLEDGILSISFKLKQTVDEPKSRTKKLTIS